MPTEMEKRVIDLLSATDYVPGMDPGKLVESWGNEAVTVACEIASGAYPGLRKKVRTNAVDAMQTIDRPQAREAVQLLVKDPDTDVSIRAIRATASQRNAGAVVALGKLLEQTSLSPLVAAETVIALVAIGSPEARNVLERYASADAAIYPHRGSDLVKRYLNERAR
jgi:uncharacterized protein with PIN domain